MQLVSQIRVWNFDLPPYPREGLFHLEMSEFCQINRLLKFEAGRLSHLNQLDIFENEKQLKVFQKELRSKLWQKMGVAYDGSLPLDIHEYGIVRKDGFTIRKLIYQSQKDVYVTALLYVPDGKGPFPAVIQMHGHNPDEKFGNNPQCMSLGLVKNGYVCLTALSAADFVTIGGVEDICTLPMRESSMDTLSGMQGTEFFPTDSLIWN